MRSPALHSASLRVGALRVAFLALFLLLAARAAHLTVVAVQPGELGDSQVHTSFVLPPARGLIVDRAGTELAVTLHAPSIYVLPDELGKLDEREREIGALARALRVERRMLEERLRGRERFTYIARWVDEQTADRVSALELAGVGIVREARRAYPMGTLAASLLGFANIDGDGVRGIEQQEDAWLRGQQQIAPVERDARGRLLARVAVAPLDAAGGDVALTLDAALQAETETALAHAVERAQAVGGSALVLDPHTGELLALAENPTFDPNRFREFEYDATSSRAFLDAYEPGSTLKAFLVASALEAGSLVEGDRIDCSEGILRIPGKTIRDARAYGILDPAGVLRVSSNVGAVQIAAALGPEAHHRALERFGFGRTTKSGFPVESAGLLRAWQHWRPVDHATVAFGQGLSVTTIQLAVATAALANGGQLVTPRIVGARREAAGPWVHTRAERLGQAVSAETARSVLDMMESVVAADGTGRLAGLANVRVAGKTGTAQKLDPETGVYSRELFIASFIGVVPAEDPRLVIVVTLDEPGGRLHSGGAVAAPLFAEVAAAGLARLGIMTRPAPIPPKPRPQRPTPPAPQQEPSVLRAEVEPEAATPPPAVAAGPAPSGDHAAAPTATKRERWIDEIETYDPVLDENFIARDGDRLLIPDFRGLSVAEVRKITITSSIELEQSGRGRAVYQEPAPGTVLSGARRQVRVRFTEEEG